MKVYLNKVSGIAEAIISMYMSKRSWTRKKELEIYELVDEFYGTGKLRHSQTITSPERYAQLDEYMTKLFTWGTKHITMLRFIDFAFTVEGLHRGATDDFDSHAKRLENRIIRSSTRLAQFGDEMSDWYKGKIISTDTAVSMLGIEMPSEIVSDGFKYVRAINGYIRVDLADSKDVQRGLYMLSIPSNFVTKVNLTELAHIVKERDKNGHAAPELQDMIESLIQQIQQQIPAIDRALYYDIQN